jgi:hypothetical protein
MDARTFTTAPAGSSIGIDPEFCGLRELEARFGIKRSTAYNLIAEGAIRSVVLRRKGTIKGRRLCDVASVRKFLALLPSDVSPVLSANCRAAQKVSAQKKAEAKQ